MFVSACCWLTSSETEAGGCCRRAMCVRGVRVPLRLAPEALEAAMAAPPTAATPASKMRAKRAEDMRPPGSATQVFSPVAARSRQARPSSQELPVAPYTQAQPSPLQLSNAPSSSASTTQVFRPVASKSRHSSPSSQPRNEPKAHSHPLEVHPVGFWVGRVVGAEEGLAVGAAVGGAVGVSEGAAVGAIVGLAVGAAVGTSVTCRCPVLGRQAITSTQ